MNKDKVLNELLRLTNDVENAGSFVEYGNFSTLMPGINVTGVGPLSIPVVEAQAEALIAISEQAPFGRGEDTVTDTSVRNCWQIDASQFAIQNPQWTTQMQSLVKSIAFGLGLPYKLLIYQTGSFFVRHRDTEKMPSMFATCVVALPSAHQGGELIVSHGDKHESISFADSDGFTSEFAAFYADCYHEVKPVISGYRVCLVYNLAIKNRNQQPLYSDSLDRLDQVSQVMRQWTSSDTCSPIFAYLLDHSYTEKNLTLDNLKNNDHSKVRTLLQAAKDNQCKAYLCLVTYYRESYGDVPYRRHYSEPDEDDFEEFDVGEETIKATEFIDIDGNKVDIGELQLYETDLFAEVGLFEGPGRECNISEATGNAGATKELWYQRGAVVIWNKAGQLQVIERAGNDYKAHFMAEQINEGQLQAIKKSPAFDSMLDGVIDSTSSAVATVLLALDDIEVYEKWVNKHIDTWRLSPDSASTFAKIVAQGYWHHFDGIVCAALVKEDRSAQAWIDTLLQYVDKNEDKIFITQWLLAMSIPNSDKDEIRALIRNISQLGLKNLAISAINQWRKNTTQRFLVNYYAPIVVEVKSQLSPHQIIGNVLDLFVKDVLARIDETFPVPVVPPTDFARDGRLNCHCGFCEQVNQFLPNPIRGELQINTFKKDLIHVEHKCRDAGIDLDVDIRHAPKRFMGTFVKNQNSYLRNKADYDVAVKLVEQLHSS